MKKVFLLLSIALLVGCGAKKVLTNIDRSNIEQKSEISDKSKIEESKNTSTNTNVKSKEDKHEKVVSNTGLNFSSSKPVKIIEGNRTYEFTPDGPVSFNTNSYYENRLRFLRDSTSRVVDSLNRKIQNNLKEISSLEEKIYSKDKNTEKEGNARPWAWAVFGAAGLAVIGYFLYKYFTNPNRLIKKPA